MDGWTAGKQCLPGLAVGRFTLERVLFFGKSGQFSPRSQVHLGMPLWPKLSFGWSEASKGGASRKMAVLGQSDRFMYSEGSTMSETVPFRYTNPRPRHQVSPFRSKGAIRSARWVLPFGRGLPARQGEALPFGRRLSAGMGGRDFLPPYFRASGVTVSSTRWPARSTVTFTGTPIFTASRA